MIIATTETAARGDPMREIVNNGQGMLRSNLSGEMEYRSFVPTPLGQLSMPSPDAEGIRLLSLCSRKIGEIEGMVRFVPNAAMYLTMYVRKEALLSAQIEGTQCTFDDVLAPDNSQAIHKDVADVIRYVDATTYALGRMSELPLCMRLLRETHARLIAGTRGFEKQPGEIRTSQNWIGPAGCTLSNAPYVPPNVEDMNDALHELELFMNDGHGLDPIVKAALIHYQFETIHPFLDGNGRLGRLLIVLSLVNDGVLSGASFYPSYHLKLNRSEYYERLASVRTEGDYSGWIRFFCQCLLDSAEDAGNSMRALVELHERSESVIRDHFARGASNALALLDALEGNPIVDVAFVTEKTGLSRTSATTLIRDFCSLGILKSRDEEKKRYRTYLYDDYLRILRAGSEPL